MNNAKDQVFMTTKGLKEAKEELHKLKEEKRPKILEKLSNAREKGDLSENAEYTTAKEELEFTDHRIIELESIIINTKVIKHSDSSKKVQLGSKISVKNGNKQLTFIVVGEWEANPEDKKISNESPLGKAVVDKKEGDQIEIEAPSGKLTYKLVKIH